MKKNTRPFNLWEKNINTPLVHFYKSHRKQINKKRWGGPPTHAHVMLFGTVSVTIEEDEGIF